MAAWTNDEPNKIGTAEEFEIAPRRRDGTLRNPVTIWVAATVTVSTSDPSTAAPGAWFRGARLRHAGDIRADGINADAALWAANLDVNDQIDAAYCTKYGRRAASIVGSIVSSKARSAPMKLPPCAASA